MPVALADGDIGSTTTLIALGGHYLIIVSTQMQSLAFPIFNMVAKVDRSGDTSEALFRVSDTEILVKGCRAVDRGLILAEAFCHCIVGPTTSEAAFGGTAAARGGVIRAVALHHIILDQRTSGPAVKRQIRVDTSIDPELTRIVYSSRTAARVPAFAAHPIVGVGGPRGSVPAARIQGHLCAAAIFPE